MATTPTLMEINWLKVHGSEEEQEYFSQFGFEMLEVDASRFPKILSHIPELLIRFNQRYAERHINKETMELWQNSLQNRMDEILPKYEAIYDTYNAEAFALIAPGSKVTVSTEAQQSGKDKVTNDTATKEIDTPDSAINHSDDYADRYTKQAGTDEKEYGRKDTVDSSRHLQLSGEEAVRSMNAALRELTEIDTMLISEFENNFINLFDYRGGFVCRA